MVLTELPVKPIRLALSIAVRTLLIAPAAANLAWSVIDRACKVTELISGARPQAIAKHCKRGASNQNQGQCCVGQ